MISQEIQEKLRSRYNPDGSELRNIQLRMLDMLLYLDGVCKKLNIHYWLSGGTCIGAVRHGGFIPWDDDIDIEVMDKDYDVLIDYLRTHETDEFVLQTPETDPNYIMDFAKLRDKTTVLNEVFGIDSLYKYQGVFVDIFRMSPSNSKIIHFICGRLRVFEIYCKKWSINNKFIKTLFPLIRHFNNGVIRLMKPIDRFRAGKNLRFEVGIPFSYTRIRKMDEVNKVVYLPFEGYQFPVPAQYDSYLRRIYGDYLIMKQDHNHFNGLNDNE